MAHMGVLPGPIQGSKFPWGLPVAIFEWPHTTASGHTRLLCRLGAEISAEIVAEIVLSGGVDFLSVQRGFFSCFFFSPAFPAI